MDLSWNGFIVEWIYRGMDLSWNGFIVGCFYSRYA